MLNFNFGNEKPVAEFVDFIRDRMKTINSSWTEIAQSLHEAREMYGSDSENYKAVLKQTKFAKSTANKLIAIASSMRLREFAEKLAAVNSWATLYAIHSMSEAKFEELVTKYKLNEERTVPPFITLNNVNSILKEKTNPDPLKIYAKIRIDEDALKSQVIDGEMLSKIEELLSQIETSFPYLKIERTGIDEKAESEFMNKVQQKKSILARQRFNWAIKGKLEQRKKFKGESQIDFEIRALGMSRQELAEMFLSDPKSVFDYIGYEYDEAKIYEEALNSAHGNTQKAAQKLHNRNPDPFKDANTSLLAA